MNITLGFSPCPNDTFIFDALVHNKIDTEGLKFNYVFGDVEELNRKAFLGELDVTKISYHALAYCLDKYALLNSGSALGFNCGPLLISKSGVGDLSEVNQWNIAIPGKYTTAYFLFRLAFPGATRVEEILFSEIENKVVSGEFGGGLIIHENRFTYEQKGLKKIIDLGEFWENLVHAPIPLGGIVAKRNLSLEVQSAIDRVLKRSVEFAFSNPESSMSFVKDHAQEMSEEVMKKHIQLYVNEFSLDLGEKGRKAVNTLFNTAIEKKLIPELKMPIFVTKA